MKKTVRLLFLLPFIFFLPLTISAKVAALVVAHSGYHEWEYETTKKVLNKNKVSTLIVSNLPGKATGAYMSSHAKIDKTLGELSPSDYDGIFFIGGPGACAFLDNEKSYEIIRHAKEAGKVVGAICYSPRILAKSGILNGKMATGWNEDNKLPAIFKTYNVFYVRDKQAVTDGTIITAQDPMAAEAFAQGIIQLLR